MNCWNFPQLTNRHCDFLLLILTWFLCSIRYLEFLYMLRFDDQPSTDITAGPGLHNHNQRGHMR